MGVNQPKLGYYEYLDGAIVELTMTRSDYSSLLLALGMAAGAGYDTPGLQTNLLGLVNRINLNNPNFTQYKLEKENK